MATRALFLIALYLLFNSFTCEDCDFFFNPTGGPELTIELEGPETTLSVGDTLWVGATFPALQSADQRSYRISEGGGLILHRLFSWQPDTSTLGNIDEAAVTPLDSGAGALLLTNVQSTWGALTRFTCPTGTCSFRQGFRFERPGTYLLEIQGSAIDDVSADFEFCENPAFSLTRLEGGNRVPGAGPDLLLPLVEDGVTLETISGNRSALVAITVE